MDNKNREVACTVRGLGATMKQAKSAPKWRNTESIQSVKASGQKGASGHIGKHDPLPLHRRILGQYVGRKGK